MDAEQLIKQTSEAVRTALEAAQRRAAEIVREAEAEAQRIRGEAETQARERLDEVRRALEQLEAGLGTRSAPRKSSKPEASKPEHEPSPTESQPRQSDPAAAESPPVKVSTEELIEQLKSGGQAAEPDAEPAPEARNEGSGDDAGAARLVAMKLALDGTARDEARKQLAADYDVDDLDSLLDEVYAKAGK